MSLYTIAILEYATKPVKFDTELLYWQHTNNISRLSLSYTLIKGQGRVALVDCGFNFLEGYGRKLGVGTENFQNAADVLAEYGLKPTDITDLLITHAHFDHMGGLDNFPNAKVYIQEEELTKWIWALTLDRKFRWITGAIDPSDIMKAIALTQQGRLVAVRGLMENVLPGVDLFPAYDTHTPGSQYVLIRNDGQPKTEDGWCITGDLVYRFENVEGVDPSDPQYIPLGYAQGSQTKQLLAMDEMVKQVGGDVRRVIPPHEYRLAQRFPSRLTEAGLNVVEITVGDDELSMIGQSSKSF